MRKITTLVAVLNLVILIAVCTPVLGENSKDVAPLEDSFSRGIIMQQANETEPQPVTLYMYGSANSGELKSELPTNATGNSASPAQSGGGNTPRHWAFKIGEWYTSPMSAPMTVEVSVSGSLWAIGNGQDVFFYINVHYNGEEIKQIETETKSVSGDTEFPFVESLDEMLNIAPGDTLAIWIYGGCRVGSNYQLAWGSSEHDSHITITSNPMSVTINEPSISDVNVVFSATIQDAFSSTALIANIFVLGDSDVISISEPHFSRGGNGTMISWDWDYKADGARSGDYTVIVSVSYSEENAFICMGAYVLEFPTTEEDDGGILEGLGWLIPLIIIIVIIVVMVVVIKVVMSRKAAKSTA